MRRPIAYHTVKTYGFEVINRHSDTTVLRYKNACVVLIEQKDEPARAVAFRLDVPEDRTAGNIDRTVRTSDEVYHLANAAAALPDVPVR